MHPERGWHCSTTHLEQTSPYKFCTQAPDPPSLSQPESWLCPTFHIWSTKLKAREASSTHASTDSTVWPRSILPLGNAENENESSEQGAHGESKQQQEIKDQRARGHKLAARFETKREVENLQTKFSIFIGLPQPPSPLENQLKLFWEPGVSCREQTHWVSLPRTPN